ncbi:alpha-1,2-fucosyltransferase [Pseudoclavibacter helvolus]|uniref:alpha-1,2-fucosyltransferase n=1 Tax=Pseudoclavibacter helvolus TaxID=255205 RepID=UPI003736D878
MPDDLVRFANANIRPALGTAELRDRLVINVRRGDYYSDPDLRAAYEMNIVAYLEEALQRVPKPPEVVVVSDDEQWCRANLSGLFHRHGLIVDYAPNDPWENFKAVTTAKCLIGTNSSFSYWGGYVSTAIDATAVVVMPGFHKRTVHAGWADQLDRRWQVIESLPGGWDE